jgi:SagB-type dehydrogenase family enzyme
MKRLICIILLLWSAGSAWVYAQEAAPIQLPAPQMEIGKPLMQALKLRQTARTFDTKALPLQELSNLLWAGFGVNRAESGKRTAPSAMNWQEIDIYVALPAAIYMYDAKANALKPVVSKDLREATGRQPFVKDAPVTFVYVADAARMKNASEEDRTLYSAADAGFIAQNVYLYCASQGLAVVVRGMVDRPLLAKEMKLRPEQRILLAQTIGYPKL